MTPADCRLAAAAACLAGPRAAALLARASKEAAAEAARLAARPRGERLRALGAALEGAAPASRSERARELADRERPRVAALVDRLGHGSQPGPGVAPALARLVRERLAR